MKLKYRITEAFKFLIFAFYPKVTLIVCAVFAIIVIGICGFMMAIIPQESIWYNIVFALTTGAAGSFFVSFVVELTSNYRHNKLAWNELQDYYSTVVDYESEKQIMMQITPDYKVKNNTCKDSEVPEELKKVCRAAQPKDIVEITFGQLPKIIPIFKKTLDEKKAFLTDTEINELQLIMSEYKHIEDAIKKFILISTMTYDSLNHPDENYLKYSYPQDVIKNMPNWIRKILSTKESEKGCDRYADAILSDKFILTQFMQDYDISLNGLNKYQNGSDEIEKEEEYKFEELNNDGFDFSEPIDEESFRKEIEDFGNQMLLKDKPFISWLISKSCKNISNSMDILEKCVLEKPYYSIILAFFKNYSKNRKDNIL